MSSLGAIRIWMLAAAMLAAASPAVANPADAQLRGTDPGEAQHTLLPHYRTKSSDVPVPPGARPGEIRRIIQPFGVWTLICDENLKTATKVCNASQTITDDAGRLAFSWSLAATRGGAPVFVLRAAVVDSPAHAILMTFGTNTVEPVSLARCDATLCVGFLTVTPDIQARISARSPVIIQLLGHPNAAPAIIETTLDGLSDAIASIR